MSAPVLAPDSIIGRYRVIELVGSGHSSQVFLVEDMFTRQLRALKVLRPELGESVEMYNRFAFEARLLSGIVHPNIGRVCGFGYHDGIDFMVLDYFEGGTLDELIEQGAASAGLVVGIGCQLANALEYLHSSEIVHRDIKPTNVMLVRRGDDPRRPVLIDFGIAEYRYDQGKNRLAGTPGYMCPAQTVEPSDDIFSLGVTIYELATQRHPWQQKHETRSEYLALSKNEIIQRVMTTRVVDPRRHVPTMSRGFAEALVWPLTEVPNERPPSAREYLLALARETPSENGEPGGLQIIERYAPELLRGRTSIDCQAPRGVLRRRPLVVRRKLETLLTAVGGALAGLLLGLAVDALIIDPEQSTVNAPSAAAEDRLEAEHPIRRPTQPVAIQHLHDGNSAYRAGRFGAAILEYEQALAVQDAAVLHYNSGQAHRRLRHWQEALNQYRQFQASGLATDDERPVVTGFVRDLEEQLRGHCP